MQTSCTSDQGCSDILMSGCHCPAGIISISSGIPPSMPGTTCCRSASTYPLSSTHPLIETSAGSAQMHTCHVTSALLWAERPHCGAEPISAVICASAVAEAFPCGRAVPGPVPPYPVLEAAKWRHSGKPCVDCTALLVLITKVPPHLLTNSDTKDLARGYGSPSQVHGLLSRIVCTIGSCMPYDACASTHISHEHSRAVLPPGAHAHVVTHTPSGITGFGPHHAANPHAGSPHTTAACPAAVLMCWSLTTSQHSHNPVSGCRCMTWVRRGRRRAPSVWLTCRTSLP